MGGDNADNVQSYVGVLELGPINSFIETETNGKLRDLVSANDMVDAVLMIITCLYFKAKWETPFKKSITQKAYFTTFQNEKQSCHMMQRVAAIHYKDDKLAQICILPYKTDQAGSKAAISDSGSSSIATKSRSSASTQPVLGSTQSPKWKAAIILPKEHGLPAMQELIKTFSTSPSGIRTFLSSPPGRHQAGRVSLSLPRFTLKLHHDLIPPLTTLGLGPAFSASNDFAPISNTGPLLINRVSHDLYIEVNEEGTEMAAVTIVAMGRSMVQVVEMKVDRPFLFMVFDGDTGLVLCSVVVSGIVSAS